MTHASQEILAVGSYSQEVTKDSFHSAQRMSITCPVTQDFMASAIASVYSDNRQGIYNELWTNKFFSCK